MDHVGIARSLGAHRKYSNGARYSKFRSATSAGIVFEKLESRSGNHKLAAFVYDAAPTMAAFDRMLLVTSFISCFVR